MDPLVAGFYAGRAEELSVGDLFPRLVAFERDKGSITRGIVAAVRAKRRMPASRLYSWRDGVGALPATLAAALAERVRSGIAVTGLGRTSSGFRIATARSGSLAARAVVLAVQPHVAAALLEGLDTAAAEAAGEISAPPMAVAFLGYCRGDVEHPLDSLGFLAADAEDRSVNGVQFCSTMFSGRAPEGHVALAAYFGGARRPDPGACGSDELLDLARGEFRDLLGAKAAPVLARVRHWPRGLPQYRFGHAELVRTIDGLDARQPGLFVTGNFLEGPAVAACVRSAQKVAARAELYLAGTQARDTAPPATAAGARI